MTPTICRKKTPHEITGPLPPVLPATPLARRPEPALLTLLSGARAADEVATTEWPAYARDQGGMRHSPLTQIDRSNVGLLQVAWTFHTGELETYNGTQFPVNLVAFEATPMMVHGALYFSTASTRVFALDAVTGQERWRYDPKIDPNMP